MATRPIWKGAISFGLVHVPVALYSLEKRFDLHFKLLDSRTKATIRYERINEVTGEEVPWDKIVKGYEYSKDNYVILDEEDFKKASIEANQLIEIQNFTKKNEIGDEYFDKPYILLPQKGAEKGYVLLREALQKSGCAGIAKVVIRTREYLAAVAPKEKALILHLLRFSQELRSVSEFDLPGNVGDYRISKREVDLALELINAQIVPWAPESYRDEYREKLMQWIRKKAKAGNVADLEPQDEPVAKTSSKVIDLVGLLRQSVEAAAKSKPKAPPTKRTKRKQA